MAGSKEFKWTPEYSVGHSMLDQQHKQLIQFTDNICQAINDGKGLTVLGETLKAMVDYAAFHFEYEEKLMNNARFYGLQQQAKEHQMFRDQVVVILKKIKQKKEVSAVEIADFLKFWINHHILGIDILYKGKLPIVEEI